MSICITGGAGFIGSNFVLDWLEHHDEPIINVDKLTYAGNLKSLAGAQNDTRYRFIQADICDSAIMSGVFEEHKPRAVVHCAAETHVDRSITGPQRFIDTNIIGTFQLLEAIRGYFDTSPVSGRASFRFLHISTDEVYGSLGKEDVPFKETTPYAPNSPYSASKAASDHLVRAYHHTYGLPVLTTNCSNNYGPYQFPEKLIPLVIYRAVTNKPLPLYGDGQQVRDWLFVRDHCSAIRRVLEGGRVGETYNIGGRSEKTNLDVVRTVCSILDEFQPRSDGKSYTEQITFVADRPGHDRRYAVDATKLEQELQWKPAETFETGIRKTVRWYLDHERWVQGITSGAYRDWIERQYAA
jgi:dTDP-glucose 4,6-dehydratase